MKSNVAALDALLGGGIEQGSSTLILGPAGTGKSTFSLQFLTAACLRGQKAAMFVFDEELSLLFDRTKPLGFELEDLRDRGLLHIIKKRIGRHEDTSREFRIDQNGLSLGAPLTELQGILIGVPTFVGASQTLLGQPPARDGHS
jgi:KaiC/GvpD/RAD55 family RecA-like ATPase